MPDILDDLNSLSETNASGEATNTSAQQADSAQTTQNEGAATPPKETVVADNTTTNTTTLTEDGKEKVVTEPAKEAVAPIVEDKPIIETKTTEQLLEEISSGKVKSAEDITKLIEANEMLSQKVQSDSYKSDYARKADAWIESGQPIELFQAINDLDVNEMSPEDQIKTQMKLENPEYSEEDIDLVFNDKYKQDQENYSEQQQKLGQLLMKKDAQAAIDYVSKLQEIATVPDRSAERAQAEQVRVASWQKTVPSIVSEFNKVSFDFNDKGEKFDYVPTAEQKKILESKVAEIVSKSQIQFNDNGIEAVKQIADNLFLSLNRHEISKAIALRATSKTTDTHIQEIHNPSGAQREVTNNAPAAKSDKEVAEGVVKFLGL